jgi:hypothetical protein
MHARGGDERIDNAIITPSNPCSSQCQATEKGKQDSWQLTGMASRSWALSLFCTTRAPPLKPAARQTALPTLSTPFKLAKQIGRYAPSKKTSGEKRTSPTIGGSVRTAPSTVPRSDQCEHEIQKNACIRYGQVQ